MNDQGIAGQHSQPFAVSCMNGWLPATGIGIVEARQIVMNQRCTVQQLNRDGRRRQDPCRLDAACEPNRQAKTRAHTGPTRKYGMLHRRGEKWRRLIFALHRPIERTMKGILDPEVWIKLNRF
jgi:hypothetical protein